MHFIVIIEDELELLSEENSLDNLSGLSIISEINSILFFIAQSQDERFDFESYPV